MRKLIFAVALVLGLGLTARAQSRDLIVHFDDHAQMRALFTQATGVNLFDPPAEAAADFCAGMDAQTDHVKSYPLGVSLERGLLCMNSHADADLATKVCSSLNMVLAAFDEPKQLAICRQDVK